MIHYTHGNILEARTDVIVVPVNCEGIVSGVAKIFAKRYPSLAAEYRDACKRGDVAKGVGLALPAELRYPGDREHYLFFLPIRDKHMQQADISYINSGLKDLAQKLRVAKDVSSVAMTALGCGRRALEWESVKYWVDFHLGDLSNEITVYLPSKKSYRRDT